MIKIYNLLSVYIIGSTDLKAFQGRLAQIVRDHILAQDSNWRIVLSPRNPLVQLHPSKISSVKWIVGDYHILRYESREVASVVLTKQACCQLATTSRTRAITAN